MHHYDDHDDLDVGYEEAHITQDTEPAQRSLLQRNTAAIAVAVAAVIAVAGSALSMGGVINTRPDTTSVDLASGDARIKPPEPQPEPSAEPTPTQAPPTDAQPTSAAPAKPEAKDGEGAGAATRKALKFPADLFSVNQWYLTLPTGSEGNPDTVEGRKLANFSNEWFKLTPNGDGIVFTANAGGATTENSKYPRSELREMNGSEKASWSGSSGTHTMELDEAITKTPGTKPDVIAAQIHGGDDDVMQIHLSGSTLTVKYADGKEAIVIDPNYKLGERFRVKIVAANGKVKVWHNGTMKAELPISGGGNYFKAGAYVNSNTSKGANAKDVGQVVIYGIKISHS